MTTKVVGLLAIGLLVGPMAAIAVGIQSSTGILVTHRYCVATAEGPCGDVSPIVRSTYGGGPGATGAHAYLDDSFFGSSLADSSLSGQIGAPILRASTASRPGSRVSTNTVALQRYVYIGSAPTTRTFGGTLTYNQAMDDALNARYHQGVRSGVNAVINVFKMDAGAFEVGNTAQSNYDSMANIATVESAPGYELLGFDQFFDNRTRSKSSASLAVTVHLNPFDAIWVWTLLQTPAADGAFVDASHTLIAGFDDVTDLVPADAISPDEQLASLLQEVSGIGPGTSLADKVRLAQTYYAMPNVDLTCSVLSDVIQQVSAQKGKKIAALVGDEVIADTQAVRVAIACN